MLLSNFRRLLFLRGIVGLSGRGRRLRFHPSIRNRHDTCARWYFWPVCRSMRSATSGAVHDPCRIPTLALLLIDFADQGTLHQRCDRTSPLAGSETELFRRFRTQTHCHLLASARSTSISGPKMRTTMVALGFSTQCIRKSVSLKLGRNSSPNRVTAKPVPANATMRMTSASSSANGREAFRWTADGALSA
jgi:hypothetical protein